MLGTITGGMHPTNAVLLQVDRVHVEGLVVGLPAKWKHNLRINLTLPAHIARETDIVTTVHHRT